MKTSVSEFVLFIKICDLSCDKLRLGAALPMES